MGIYLVTINNLRRCINHKMMLGITFFLPLLICLLVGGIKFSGPSFRIGILNQDSIQQRKIAKEASDILRRSKGVSYAKADANTMNTDLMTGRYQMILDLRDKDNLNDYKLLGFQSSEKKKVIKNIIDQAILTNQPVDLFMMKKEGLSKTERSFAWLVTLFMVISTIQASKIILDRQTGTMMRYQFARKSRVGYVSGVILFNFIMTFIQLTLCLFLLKIVQTGYEIKPVAGLILCVVMAALAVLYSTLICMNCKNDVQANIIASSLAAVMSLLGGTFIAVENMPGVLQILSLFSPIRWILELYRFM